MDINHLSSLIINVHKELGPGLLESVYQRCMVVELENMVLRVQSEVPVPIFYQDRKIHDDGFKIDLLVEDTIIVELKSVRQIVQAHEVQLVNYLVATGKPVGLLLNFGEDKVEVKRKVRELQ